MYAHILKFYWRLERLIHPSLRFSQYHYMEALRQRVAEKCVWEDLGCGHQMFAEWMKQEETTLAARAEFLVGIDLDWAGLKQNTYVNAKVFANLEHLPLADATCDLATANMVAEHLERPVEVLTEIRRTLRPGGLLILHTPNRNAALMRAARLAPQWLKVLAARLFEARREEDVFPTYYRINTAEAIAAAARASGLEVEEVRLLNSTAVTAVLGPLAVFELLYLRFLENPRWAYWRSNLIAVLRRPAAGTEGM